MEQRQGPIGQPGGEDSLSPVQSRRLTVEAEVSMMNRGRGRQLVGAAAAVVGLGVLGVLTLQYLARSEQYASAATALSELEQEQFEGYFACVLPGASSSHFTTATRVHTALERLGDRMGRKYAATLRSCGQRLPELSAGVERLSVPGDLAAEHAALEDAVRQLQQAHAAYQKYLDDGSKPYEFVRATPLIE